MKRLLLSAALAALVSLPTARAAEPKRVIVCTVTTGFRHSSIPFAEKTLQKLADESKAFTIVEYVRQPGVDVPNAPRKPNPPKADANDNDKKRYENDLKKYEAEMAKWTPEMEKARKEAEGLRAEGVKQALARLSPQVLNDLKIDGVIFANTTGDLPLPDKEGFIKWIEAGHAFMAMHSASDTFHQFPGYIGMLGGEFKTHGKQVPADLVKVDPNHPATQGLPDSWNLKQEEMYEFKTAADLKGSSNPPHDRTKIHALWMLRHPPQQPDVKEYAGVSWCKKAGEGRVFYTSLGHREDLWSDDPNLNGRVNDVSLAKQYQQHILGGIKWALGLAEGDATPNPNAP